MEGKFIVFEGLDKCGKRTQAELLKDWLDSKGIESMTTLEPNPNNPFGRMIRDFLNKKTEIDSGKSVALLYTTDRYEHLKTIVLPNLEKGIHVISERYFYSTIVYQSVLYGVDPEWIREMNRFARKPDLVIFLDIPPEESIRRAETRDRHETLEFQTKIRKAFEGIIEKDGFIVIDGNRAKEEVFEDVKKAVEGETGL
jgi:dTMP kinase